MDPRTPVIVGAGQVTQECGADGPVAMAAHALRRAAQDSGAGERVLRRADSARHVATICWSYTDEAALIAQELGASPRETVRTSAFGGDGPQRLIADTARAIAAGELDVALLSGAEAIVALRAARAAGAIPAWPDQGSGATPTRIVGTDRAASNEAETVVGLLAPVYNYALLETAVRGQTGTGPAEHMAAVASLWSRFSEVAAGNPHARIQRRVEAGELLEASESNRPVSAPYPKLLTANANVDQATGLIMCSAQAAGDLGVPPERWVFVLACAHASDEWFLSERRELAASPAIRSMGAAALAHAGIGIDEVAYVDLYSCFPSAVQIAASELGLGASSERPLTVTGGLTFAGGPGNNYSSHAVATMVGLLREDPEAVGLCTAMGWYATKHACGVYSGRPGDAGFREIDAVVERPAARVATAAWAGVATVEAYTVPYGRDGEPEAVIFSGLVDSGERALWRSFDPEVVALALEGDPLGREVDVGAGLHQ